MTAKYETTIELPSRGKLYESGLESITLRAMTTAEEKMLLGSTGENAFDRILKECIVEPKDIKLAELLPADKHFILIKLRTHTYGSMYNIQGRCEACGEKSDFAVNLDEFYVNELDDDFEEPIEFTLPISGDKLSCKLLRGSDMDLISTQARKVSKRTKAKVSELEYTMRMARHITKINGEETDFGKAQNYVKDMHGQDSAYFWYELNKQPIGLDTTVEETCPECGEAMEFFMPINSEFFRPKFG